MRVAILCQLMFVLSFAFTAAAGEVSVAVSSSETYVDLPITLQIKIEDAGDHERPEIPDVDGLDIVSAGPPSRSSQVSIVNGRRSASSSVTYHYRVTPTRLGQFTIPPIQISSDGQTTLTKAVRIVANKSETNDLLFVEITGGKERVYVGQAIELTLKIWIRPFKSPDHNVTLSEENMWGLLSDQTTWGPFTDRMNEWKQDRKRPGGELVMRKDSEGNDREYLLYEIAATIYPDRPGKIEGDDVRVVFNYPEELGRSRSPLSIFDDDPFFGDSMFGGFGSRLTIKNFRPIAAKANVDDIEIRSIPIDGRPEDYRGAVGHYTISTSATPTEVQAGDPITLRIDIEGTGLLDRLRAPPLSETAELTADFKIADDSLSGIVDGSQKRFTTTIRPLRAGIAQIPPIGFSYFDPQREAFVTSTSKPIAINVTAAEQLDLAMIDGRPSNRRTGSDSVHQQTSGQTSAANRPQLRRTFGALDNKPPADLIDRSEFVLLAAFPLLFGCGLLFQSRHWFPKRMFPYRILMERKFRRAVEGAQSVAEVADSIEFYLREKYGLNSDQGRRDQTVGVLRGNGLTQQAIRVERLYSAADRRQIDQSEIESFRQEALEIAAAVRSKRGYKLPAVTSLIIVLAVNITAVAGESLSSDEAGRLFSQALQDYANTDFDEAAKKFQQLVDSGITNDALFFDLAMAYEQQGNRGLAIANYRRALRIEPEQTDYHRQLSGLDDDQKPIVPRELIRWCFFVAWSVFWLTMLVLLFRRHVGLMLVALVALIIFVGTGTIRVQDRVEFTRNDRAVIVQAKIEVRRGDGEEFEVIAEQKGVEGKVVNVLGERAGWAKIRFDSGTVGWVPGDTIRKI